MSARQFIALHALLARGRSFDHPVCHDGQRLVSWREFSGRVAALADDLEARHEKRWLLAAADAQSFAIGLLALIHAGKEIVVPPNLQAGTLTALAGVFDARLSEADLVAPGEGGPAREAIDAQQVIIDLYTSGSTGEPKRVRKSLAALEAEVAVLERLWGSRLGSASVIATVPHQHIYGLLFRLLWPLSAGRVFDTTICSHPDTLEKRLQSLGESVLIASPAQLSRLPELVALSELRPRPGIVFSSGGPLPPAVAARFFAAWGAAPIEVFGSTESGGIAWRCFDESAEADRWRPFPGIAVRGSERGALLLSSPFLGTSATLEMEDAIELFADGRFRLLGRLDRIVKVEEKRVSLPEMEARLNAHPALAACALVALARRRQEIGAVLVLSPAGRMRLETDGKRALVRELRTHLAAHFEAVVLPRHWRIAGQLPTNDSGKLAQASLAALFAAPETPPLLPPLLPQVDSVTCVAADECVLELFVAPELAHFAGHFPGQPILPGVVEVDWALRLARDHLPLAGGFSRLENVKFLGLVLPGARLALTLKWDAANGRLDFTYARGERRYASGRVVLAAKP